MNRTVTKVRGGGEGEDDDCWGDFDDLEQCFISGTVCRTVTMGGGGEVWHCLSFQNTVTTCNMVVLLSTLGLGS